MMLRILSLAVILLQLHFSNGQTVNDITVSFPPNGLADEGDTFSAELTLNVAPTGDFVVTVTNSVPLIESFEETVTFIADNLQQTIADILIPIDNVVSSITAQQGPLTLSADGMQASPGSLVINDRTVLTASFVQPAYTFNEGENVMVCVSIDGSIAESAGSFTVQLQITDGTAIGASSPGAGDFTTPASPATLQFDSDTVDMTECAEIVSLRDDAEAEGPEEFTVQITAPEAPIVISQSSNSVTITVLDLQTNCGTPPSEGGVSITVSGHARDGGVFVANEGATASYICTDEAFIISGVTTLTCTVDGATAMWSPAGTPMCQRGNCGPLPENPSGDADMLDITLAGQYSETDGVLTAYRGSTASYSCDSDTSTLIGSQSLECVVANNTAMWNPSTAPYCDAGHVMKGSWSILAATILILLAILAF